MTLDLGLKREFGWFFVIADIDKPILGVDFIDHYGLLIDIKRRCFRDSLTNLSSIGVIHNIVAPGPTVANALCDSRFTEFIKGFPDIVKPNFQKNISHNVTHHIITNGPPVHAKPMRLPIEKFKYARKEFNQVMQLDIIRPSSSNWASPLHLVSKGNGAWRACGDYCALNAVTRPERYPISHIHDVTAIIQGKSIGIFSPTDSNCQCSGYIIV